jgi:hypothetical protein
MDMLKPEKPVYVDHGMPSSLPKVKGQAVFGTHFD